MEGLDAFEQAVLDKLLVGDHPALTTLRTQAARARMVSREHSGAGFFCTFEVPADAPRLEASGRFTIDDVNAEVSGVMKSSRDERRPPRMSRGMPSFLQELFEDPPRHSYGTDQEQIESVAMGAKRMLAFTVRVTSLQRGDDECYELISSATRAGLSVTIEESTPQNIPEPHREAYLFIHKNEDAWRVCAYLELMRNIVGKYDWSDGLEALQSRLLGYSQQQIESWLALRKRRAPGWSGLTVYLLMTSMQYADVRSRGVLAIDRNDENSIVAFYPVRDVLLKQNLEGILPDGMYIGRIAITYQSFQAIWGDLAEAGKRRKILWHRLTSESVSVINRGARSNIEFQVCGRWECGVL